ncbi:MurR/RpiR family transcriptional regulator HpxU [soil metagenome]
MASSLADRIDTAYVGLTPQEQRAADFMRLHLADLAVYNATEVARLSGVSKATVSRLYRRLGFDSADDLREHVRGLRTLGTPVPSRAAAAHATHLAQELANLAAALGELDLAPAAEAIASADRVVVMGFRNSYPMALHLRQQLVQARPAVELVPQPGQSIGEELAGLTAADVVVLVGFRRRPESFARVASAVGSSPAALVLLTDPSGRGYARHADHVIECPLDAVSAFDSYAAAASIIALLASMVLARGLSTGGARIAAINAAYQHLHELEGP